MFVDMDANHDGFLTNNEFVNAMTGTAKGTTYQCTLSTHAIITRYQHISTHAIHYEYALSTLSTHSLNAMTETAKDVVLYLITHPINTRYQHTLSTYVINPP